MAKVSVIRETLILATFKMAFFTVKAPKSELTTHISKETGQRTNLSKEL